MDFYKFENVVKKINKNKYHISRSIRFDKNGNPYISEWYIYRKDMSINEYFDSKNKSILSSIYNNTLEDIENLIKEDQ